MSLNITTIFVYCVADSVTGKTVIALTGEGDIIFKSPNSLDDESAARLMTRKIREFDLDPTKHAIPVEHPETDEAFKLALKLHEGKTHPNTGEQSPHVVRVIDMIYVP